MAILEEEYETLRKMKIEEPKPEANGDVPEAEVNGNADQADVPMANAEANVEEDAEPTERGSEAVEKRVQKLMEDFVAQGIVSATDEKALEAKRVRFHCRPSYVPNTAEITCVPFFFADGDSFGSVPRLPSSSVQHVLLLRSYCRSSRGIAAEVY